MDNGRLNFKATIDDNDFNRKLDGMKKGVNGLNEALNKNLSNQTSLINKNNNAFLEQRKLLNELKQSLSKATDKTEIARYEKSINDATNALRKLNEEAKKTPKTAPNVIGGGSVGALPNPAIIGATATATDKATRSFGGLFKTIASSFGIMSAFYSVMGLIRGAFNTIVEFDSKLLNVSKTTGLAGQELKDLGVSLRALSQELEVVSVSKLTEYASVAGQLGVKGSADILAFSKALAQLEVTSNISGAEGGSQIARLLTLVDGGVTNVKAFGDEITRLGNNFPATEAEILKNSLAVAQNTGVYKLGRQEILAYGTATKSIGVEAELTGASIGRTLAVLENSIRTGKNASNVMSITGKSVEDLKSQFKTDPQSVLYSFVKGLNDIDKSGGSVNNALQSIGITAVRDQRVLGSLATGGFDVLTRALEDAGSASGAMQQEFETASGKIENSIEGVKVSWENFVLALNSSENSLGNLFSRIAGGISGVIDMIREATTSVRELNQESRQTKLNESYEEAKFYYGLGFGTNEKAREQAIKDEQKFLKQARDLNDKIAKEQKKLDDINNNRGILASAFMGKSDIAPIERDLKKFNDQLGDVEGNIKAINDLYDEWRGKENKTTTTKTPEELESDADRKKRESAEKRAAKQTESQYKKQVQFLDEVAKVERELNQSVLTGREEAMAKISNKYDDLIKKARELKVTETEINRINELRAKETAITTYRLDTTALVTSLEARKTDYEAFEEYKKKVGIEKATEMYAGIIDVSKNYQQVLQDELASFDGKDLTDVEKERVNELFKLLQNYSIQKQENDRKSLEELLIMTQSFEQKILNLRSEYDAKRRKLTEDSTVTDLEARLAILDKEFQEKARELISGFADEKGFGTAMTQGFIGATKQIITAQIESLRNYLKNAKDLTKSQVDEIEKIITGLDEKLYSATDSGEGGALRMVNNQIDGLNKSAEKLEARKSFLESLKLPESSVELAEIEAKLIAINLQLDTLSGRKAKAISEEFGKVSNIFSSLAGDFEAMGGGANNIFKSLSKVAGLASTVSNVFADMKAFNEAQKSEGGASFSQTMSAAGGVMSAVFGISSMIMGVLDDYKRSVQAAEIRRIESYIKSLEFERELASLETERLRRSALSISDRQKESESIDREILLKQKQLMEIQQKLNTFSAFYLRSELPMFGDKSFTEMFGNVGDLQAYYDKLKEMRDLGQEMNQEQKEQLAYLDAFWLGNRSWEDLQRVLNNLKGNYTHDEMRAYVEEAIKLAKELEEAGYSLEDVQNMMRELSTGTSVQDLSNRLADAFSKGEDAAISFADTIEEVLKNAIISSFKNEFIVKEMDAFFKKFGDMGANGYTDEELDKIRQEAQDMANRLQEQWDALYGSLDGFDFGGGDFGAGASDGIKRITETQADRLTGILTGMQVDVIESRKSLQISNNLLSSSLDNLIGIEFNTRRTYESVERIEGILQNNQQKALGL